MVDNVGEVDEVHFVPMDVPFLLEMYRCRGNLGRHPSI
jgi:hypothetical protein